MQRSPKSRRHVHAANALKMTYTTAMNSSLPRPPISLGVAQMAERAAWDREAAGSRPATQTKCGIAQMAEHRAHNPTDVDSIATAATTLRTRLSY